MNQSIQQVIESNAIDHMVLEAQEVLVAKVKAIVAGCESMDDVAKGILDLLDSEYVVIDPVHFTRFYSTKVDMSLAGDLGELF